MLLFVYGCLKRNGYLSPALTEAQFLKTTKTVPQFKLYNILNFPGMIPAKNGSCVLGELWDVSEENMEELDYIEGIHIGLFRRELIDLESGEKAFAYIYNNELDENSKDIGNEWINY